ncbi:peptidase M4 [Streptomyces sp. ZEA17I]|uniref:PepSY domain-containing protein n=1 Tax=Streptomyces sp. ZEA17I TaxID=2202516 RepID=UPI000D701824|nr:PepSY domain-containing protein [Streptomyces sp. ZEA17I]PWS43593.1 peptidase M4 [Streptomyces sp. ZEA17I]
MKRNATIAAITAAVLIGGTAAATVAFADDDGDRRPATTTQQPTTTGRDTDDRDDDRDDRNDDRSPATGTGTGTTAITLDQAVAAALKSVPGTVTEAELDDDDDDHGGRTVWELDVHGSDKKWHDVTVDATTGKVLKTRQDDDNDDRDRHAPRSAPVTLNAAADAALKTAPGRITSIDLDDDDDDDDGRRGNVLRWDVDITGKDGRQHELKVDAKTGKVTVDRDDDRDDRDDADDRNDDRDDD